MGQPPVALFIRTALTRISRVVRLSSAARWARSTLADRHARLRAGIAAMVALGVIVGFTCWILWPDPDRQPAPRARQYLAFTACLLTDAQGLAGQQAAAVWAGMQDASLATRAKVQYLPVTGEATEQNASTYLTSLIQRQCAVIVTAGPAQAAAVALIAPHHPKVRFAVLGPIGTTHGSSPTSTSGSTAPGAPQTATVTTVPWSTPDTVRAAIDRLIRESVRESGETD